MNNRVTAIIQYTAAVAALLLAVFVGYRSYVAWKLYSNAEEAVIKYDSGSFGPAQESLSNFTVSHRSEDPSVTSFETNLLCLQDYHERSVKILENSGHLDEGIIKLALASEMLFSTDNDSKIKESISLLQQAMDTYIYPDTHAALGGAYIRAGEIEKAGPTLKIAQEDAGKLTFDGLLSLFINLGVYHLKQGEFRDSIESFKKIIELLPRRKVPALTGLRETALESGERGLAFACTEWLTAKNIKTAQRKEAIEYASGLMNEKRNGSGSQKDRWELEEWRYLIFNALGLAYHEINDDKNSSKSFSDAFKHTRRAEGVDSDMAKQRITLSKAIVTAAAFENENGIEGNASDIRNAAKKLAESATGDKLDKNLRYIALNLSACLYAAAQRENNAIEILTQAIDLYPDGSEAMLNMAICLDRQGKKTEAIKTYEKVLNSSSEEKRKQIESRLEKLKE